jgi:hypothetical protein
MNDHFLPEMGLDGNTDLHRVLIPVCVTLGAMGGCGAATGSLIPALGFLVALNYG